MIRDNIRVEPRIRLLTQVLTSIDEGNLRVPKFQRPFVWTTSKMLALFDSIYRGYPVGSLLFWKTSKEYNSLPNIGLHDLTKTDGDVFNYILDGHQRLSTLYGVLKKTENFIPDKLKKKWLLFFDLEEEKFSFHPSKGNIPLHWFPMNAIIDTFDFLKSSRDIHHNFPEKGHQYVQRAEDLAKSILNYQVTITQIEGGKIESAVEIFSRLNSTGEKISDAQMLTALTYSDDFHLSTEIEKIKLDLEDYYFSGIASNTILRVIFTASGREIYESNIQKLANEDMASIVKNAREGIIKAAKFFYNDLNVPGNNFLPYSLQFILFSEFFRICPHPSSNQELSLKKYFWITSFTGWFRGANTSKAREALYFIRKLAEDEEVDSKNVHEYIFSSILPLPESFHVGNARIKTFVLFLLNSQKSKNRLEETKHLLGKYGSKALSNAIKKKELYHNHSLMNVNTPENTLALTIDKNSSFINEFLYSNNLKNYSNSFLNDHFITNGMLNLLKNGRYEEFLNKRRFLLKERERNFMMKNGVNF